MYPLLALVLACTSPDDTGKPADSPDDTADTSPGGETGDTASGVTPPCSDGGWGEIDPAVVTDAVHVSTGAAGEGNGTPATPFASIAEALAVTRAGSGAKVIVLWPGEYAASLDLAPELGDDGLRILGCGSGEVTLVGEDNEVPVVRLSGVQDAEVLGVTVSGGRRGVQAWQGATLALTDVHAVENLRTGILIDGSSSVAELQRVEVSDPVPEPGAAAYGLAIQGASVTGAGVSVSGAGTAGILIDGSSSVTALSDVTVEGTNVAEDGRFGRGVQVQGFATASLTHATLADNHDAGLFALQAVRLTLTGVTVTGTLPALVDDGAAESADGLTVTDGAPDEDWMKTYFAVELADVAVDSPARAGVLLSGNGVAATLSSVTISGAAVDPGAGAVLLQDGATGTGGPVYALDAGDTLPFAPDLLTTEDAAQ